MRNDRGVSYDKYARYSVPLEVKIVECKKDVNGEWIPISFSPLEIL